MTRHGLGIRRLENMIRRWALVTGLLLLGAGTAGANVITLDLAPLNGGNHLIGGGGTDLPPNGSDPNYTIDVDGTDTQGQIHMRDQIGGVVWDGPLVADATATAFPNVIATLPFEGFNQVVFWAEGDTSALPGALFRNYLNAPGDPHFFTVDQGPPDNVRVTATVAPNGVVDAGNQTITFNRLSATPFDTTFTAVVENLPTAPDPVRGEVRATVEIRVTRVSGGSIAPVLPTYTLETGPPEVSYTAVPPVVAAVPGEFTWTVDWQNVQDGTYEVRLVTIQDFAGNGGPNDGNEPVWTVVIDRQSPALIILRPTTRPFIIDNDASNNYAGGVVEDGLFDVSGYVSEALSAPATVWLYCRNRAGGGGDPIPAPPALQDYFTGQTLTAPVTGTFQIPVTFTDTGPGLIGALFATYAPGTQDLWRIDGRARDGSGNDTQQNDFFYLIHDNTAPISTPEISQPPVGFATSATELLIRGRLDNDLGSELEEHGNVVFFVTIYPSANPTARTTFTLVGGSSLATHDSTLDDAAPNFPGTDVLGEIPNEFTFEQLINLDAWPDGLLTIEVLAMDGMGNFDPANAGIVEFAKGQVGPRINVNLSASGPDDNYPPPNSYGADDRFWYISQKSPESADPIGGLHATPFPGFPNNQDPGTADALYVTGSYDDIASGVTEVFAWGPNVPTTSVVISPAIQSGTFTLPFVDVSSLGEGVPELLNIQARNELGQLGPVENFIILRDVIPARRPSLSFPTGQPYFTNAQTLEFEGIAEPNATVAVITPTATGLAAVPIHKTQAASWPADPFPFVPRRDSNYNSIPAGAVTTVADENGRWRIASVDLSTISTTATEATTLFIQAIDSFDNTDDTPDPLYHDPYMLVSAMPFRVQRNPVLGNPLDVWVDYETTRRQYVYSTPPADPPTSGQFRGLERVHLRIRYDSLVVEAPALKVQQSGGAAARMAQLVRPAPGMPLSTQILVFQYDVLDTRASYDGAASLDFSGGKDIFGNVLVPLEVNRAFYVDSVAPVTSNQTTNDFLPATGAQVTSITSVAVDLIDRPATSATTSSGLDAAWSEIRLFGPLETNPDLEQPLATAFPDAPWDLAAAPASAVTSDGVYRIAVHAVDAVGNDAWYFSTFILDRRPIPSAVAFFTPECGSAVRVLPQWADGDSFRVLIRDPQVDLAASWLALTRSDVTTGVPVAITTSTTGENVLVGRLDADLATDGSEDGSYTMAVTIVDEAGNVSTPASCSFIYDTQPPFVLAFTPNGELTCVRDPLREVRAEIADVPANPNNIGVAGVDLLASSMELRLQEAMHPNKTAAETLLQVQKKIRSVEGQNNLVLALEILGTDGHVRSLADDGSEDGIYRIAVDAVDRAGNTTHQTSTFKYDTQKPRVTLMNFPEKSFFADSRFTIGGEAFDLGLCGFDPTGLRATLYPTGTVQVRLEALSGEEGVPVSPITTPFFDWRNVDRVEAVDGWVDGWVRNRCRWFMSGDIPDRAGPARLSVRVRDLAGNETVITREITIQSGGMTTPRPLVPADGSVTNEKTLVFQWEPTLYAFRYDLEISRVTPTGLTTATTFAVPFPTNRFLVDLPLLVTDSGGSPIDTPSVFSWRMRAFDVSENPGPFGESSLFTVDSSAPVLIDVLLDGVSTTQNPTVTTGTVQVQIDWFDHTGLDTTVAPTVTWLAENPNIPPQTVRQTAFTSTTWTGVFDLPPSGTDEDPNGTARLVINGFQDLASNPAAEVTTNFAINVGPWFDLVFFPNPVNPLDLLFSLLARDRQGGSVEEVVVAQTPALQPLVEVRQQGQVDWTTVSVNPYAGTTVPNSAFAGRYVVNPHLIGYVDFRMTATDLAGRVGRRTQVAAIARAMVDAGIIFPGVNPQSQVVIPPGALTANQTLINLSERNVGASALGQKDDGNGGELMAIQAMGAYYPENLPLRKAVTVQASTAGLATLPFASRQYGIYRREGSTWALVPGLHRGNAIEAETRKLGHFYLMADLRPPRLSDPRPAPGDEALSPLTPLSVAVTEGGAGVDPVGVQFLVDGKNHGGRWDAATGRAVLEPSEALSAGQHEIVVQVADRAGNLSSPVAFSMAVAGPLTVSELVPYPNPCRSAPVALRYRLSSGAAEVRLEVFDAAGRLVWRAPTRSDQAAGTNLELWDLRNRRGRPVANGVYHVRIRARGHDASNARRWGKIAVLR